MLMRRIILALILLKLSEAKYNPLKDPNICGRPQCEDGGKFKYVQNVEYYYNYSVHVSTLFVGTSKNESVIHLNAGFRLSFPTRCEGLLNFHNVELADENDSETSKSIPFGEAIKKYPLRFAFHDGYINEVCPDENEPSWVLNFKKGLLSTFQNTMLRFDMDHNVLESDVSGNCDTVYSLQGAKKTSLTIKKTRDLQSCTHRYTHHSVLQTTPYDFRQNFQAWPVLNSTNICEQSIDDRIYNNILCEEKHIFRPFSNREAGATTITRQLVSLVSTSKTQDTMNDDKDLQGGIKSRSSLHFDHVVDSKPTHSELKVSRDFLKRLCQLGTDEIQREYTDAFNGFIQSAKSLSHTALSQVLARADSICPTGSSHMLEALPYIGSIASVQLMRDQILAKNRITQEKARSWMWSFAFTQRPGTEILEAMKPLLENNIDDSIFPLSVSSLVHSFCKYSKDCFSSAVVQDLVQILEERIDLYKRNLEDRETIARVLVLLKAIGNAGVVTDDFSDTLLDIINDPDILLVVRLGAIEAHRRLSCTKTREFFIELLKNQQQPTELRIASYLQIMRCPNYLVINTIKNTLDIEEVNQVGSFIWSHLHNLVRSANPVKVEVQSLVSDHLLGQKFNLGIRKYSRNYEYSIFFEDYNMGGNVESNVIFSPESYIPRSLLLNMTVDVFGESLNLFEINTRLEGFEHYIESIFGPDGPLSSEKVKDVVRGQINKLSNLRFPRQASNVEITAEDLKSSIDKLPYKLDYNYNTPKLSLGMKIFGNDLQYVDFEGNEEVQNVANAMNPMTYVYNFLSGKEIKFKKAGVFLDASYSIPTYTGFPLNLKVHGSSGVDFKMIGSLKADNFFETKKMNLKGHVTPSVTVDVVGTMEVDAFYTSTGIKLKTNLYSSSAVEVVLVIESPKLVSLELSLPKEKTEIFSAKSELVVVQNEVDQFQSGHKNFINESSCSWPVFNKAIGLEFCANYTIPNVTKAETVPSFLLSGPVTFNIALHKADPTAKKYVFEYKWENLNNISYVSFIFNTPNSEMKRLLGSNITLADNSKNFTVIFNSDTNTFLARGLYKNNHNSITSNITLDINGNKHLDAHFEWTIRNETHGHLYIPKLYLAVNSEKVAELTGLLKAVTKKNISQYDIKLRFETKRLVAVLMGYVTDSEASTSTKLKLDYKFLESRLENVKIEGSVSNLSDRNRTHRRGEFKLETTAYPQYNFVSALTFINHLGHVDCKIDINTSKNLTDPNHTLTIHTILLLNNSYESSKYSAQISVFKPISRLDVGLQLLYEKMGFQHHGWIVVKYAPTKEIISDIDVSFISRPSLQADGKFNLTIPSFVPFVIEGSIAEKSQREYVINLNTCWFTGHTMTARAFYNNNSTASRTSHYLKLHMKSPGDMDESSQKQSHEVDVNCRYHHDKKELRLDVQVSHNGERYGILVKHLEPSASSMSSYLKIRYKAQIYSITSTIEMEHPNKQLLLDIHLDKIRDIHLALRGINGKVKKEFGVEVKWDANRDPGQKAVLSVEMHRPKPSAVDYEFVLTYPGRTVTGSLGMKSTVSQRSDYDYTLTSRVMWSPQDEVSLHVAAGYRFQPGIFTKLSIDLYTPFDHWSRTLLHLSFLLQQNLIHVDCSVLWESNNQISIDIFGDYEITSESFRCTYNSSLISTIQNVPSLSAFLKHKHNHSRIDTEINVKYNPEQVISIVSGWQLDRELLADTLSGMVTINSPFKGYGKGLLVCKITLAHNRTLHGAAELNLENKKYTLVIKGHLQKLTNNMLNFNITTPIQKYSLLTGRFGVSEELRHAVAEIRTPTDCMGLELLLDVHTTSNFDVKFYLATPFEQVKDIMLVGKLKQTEVDFRAGWNSLVLGFAGVWRYKMLTDMEYSFKFFIPIEHFEENGVVVKIIYNEELDLELSLQLSDKKIGIKAVGRPNQIALYREFGFKRPLLFEPIQEEQDEYSDEEEMDGSEDISEEDYASWSGLIELDTLLYPTMKGILNYEKIDTIRSISGSLALEEGEIELRNDFQMLDVFTMRNQLLVISPFEQAKNITLKYDLQIEMGSSYLVDADLHVLSYNDTHQGRLLVNYTVKDLDNPTQSRIHHALLELRTPIENLSLAQAQLVYETQEGLYRVNVTGRTSTSEASFAGNLEMFKDYLEATGGMRLSSNLLNIPMVTFLAKKDFSEIERRLELGFGILENNTWQKFDIETSWHVESDDFINMKIMVETPIEAVSKLGCSILVSKSSQSSEPTASASLELHYKEHELTVNAGRQGSHVTFELTTPLEEFRNISFDGELEQEESITAAYVDASSYRLKGTLRSGPRKYRVQGDVIVLDSMPLKINVEMIPHQPGEPKTLQYVWARTPTGHAITARMDSGKRYLAVSGEAAIRHKYDWDLGLHIDSSVTVLRNLNFKSNLKSLPNDRMTFDLEMTSPIKKLARSNLTVDVTLIKENGNMNVAYALESSHGSIATSWVYHLMQDMRVNVVAQQHLQNKPFRYASLAAKYINPSTTKKKFDNLTIGADLNIDNLWKVGSNVSIAMPSFSDAKLDIKLLLPPPHADLHHAICKYKSTNDPKDLNINLFYETEVSELHYSANAKMLKNVSTSANDTQAELELLWGTKKDKKVIGNYLHMVQDNEHRTQLDYNLTTPKYKNEETIITSLNYDKDNYYHNASGILRIPASRLIASADVAYHSFENTHGIFNCSTPLKKLPWLGGNFKLNADEHNGNSHFVRLLWPNNSAFLDSHYFRVNNNQSQSINGTLLIELPLNTRHLLYSEYDYNGMPLFSRGSAILKYNNKTFLNSKYECKSENRAGYNKDNVVITLDNKHTPVGVNYIHVQQQDMVKDSNMKRVEVYHLYNRTGFNVTGELHMLTTPTGRRLELLAVHTNRTVRLTTEHDVKDRELEHRSRLQLATNVWLAYKFRLLNYTMMTQDAQKFELDISYPRRNLSAVGSYRLTNEYIQSEATLTWDRNVSTRTMSAGLDWRNVPGEEGKHTQTATLTIKHPSFEKDVTFRGELRRQNDRELLYARMFVEYCNDPNSLVELCGSFHDNSDTTHRNYSYKIIAVHKATQLDLDVRGSLSGQPGLYKTFNHGQYKRSYLPLQQGEIEGTIDVPNKEILLQKINMLAVSRLWGRAVMHYPYYQINGTLSNRDIDSKGEFYLNMDEKLIRMDVNMTPDASQSMHVFGTIPDARSASFNVWRDYEDIRVSDVSFYWRLNHSKLITGQLTWRPKIKEDMKGFLQYVAVYIYDSINESADYWRQYIRTETMDAIKDVWQDAEPYIQNYLDELHGLKVLEQDFEEFRNFLNQSYYSDDFYIQDIVGFFNYVIDELAIRSPIQSLPDIINEIWEIMGESGQALRKSILWLIETAKASYKKAVELISKILHGDSMTEITAILEGIIERYDKFIKDLHVSFIKYMEQLWVTANEYIEYHWKKTIQSLEPSFIKFVHYVETIVWKVSREVLDFLYVRTNEIAELPYFTKFTDFTQDLDHIYKDFTANDIFTNIYKYSSRVWNFLCEKYFRLIPFSKELQDVADEIMEEFKQLQELPSFKYILVKVREIENKITWFFDYFEVKSHLQHALKLLRTKLTEITQTALQTENMYREAKTNFIFDPETGLMKLEQKLPMSWHAFNETPKFEEIPEFKAISNLQSYLEVSNTTFWTLYYEYKPVTEPSTWLPPFKAHAVIVGGSHYISFDGRYTSFEGDCSYLLAHDFLDGNFSIALSAPRSQNFTRRFYIQTAGVLVTVDISAKHIHVILNGVKYTRLPMYLEHTLMYRDFDVFIIESDLGYTIECNLQYDICIVKLTGWYFGKTAGLLGTMNNEPSDDIITSKKQKPTTLQEWAKSWSLDIEQCSKNKEAPMVPQAPPQIMDTVLELCDGFFKNKASAFAACFGVVEADPFYNICVNQVKNKSTERLSKMAACSAAVAYQQVCTLQHTPLRIPDTCVQCELINGSKLNEGERIQFDPQKSPRTADIVFLIDSKSCNEDLLIKKSAIALIQSIEKELQDLNITQNRYAAVIFGGVGAATTPISVVINNEIFTDHSNFNMYLDPSIIGSKESLSKGDAEGSKDIFEAVAFASKLVFRPGVSKIFITLPCSTCNPKDMKLDYAAINSLLLESGIKLHMLINEEFTFDKVKTNKAFYGIDQVTAYTKKDVNGLIGDKELRDSVRLPKATLGYCSRLALGSNGSLFTAKKMESDKRNPVKKFVSVFAKRVAVSAVPSACQICECTARDYGTAYTHCHSCDYQTPPSQDTKFMDESSVLALLQDFSFDRDFESDYVDSS